MDNGTMMRIGVLKIGAVFITVWYLFLVYRFPFSMPYKIPGDLIVPYCLGAWGVFLMLVISFAVFAVRMIRLIGYAQPDKQEKEGAGRQFFATVESYYVYQVRILAVLSFLVLSLNLVHASMGNALPVLAFVFVAAILLNAALKWVLSNTGDITAPRWSPGAWVALLTFVGLVAYAIENLHETVAYAKQLFFFVWALLTRAKTDHLDAESIIVAITYLIILAISGIRIYRDNLKLLSDIRQIVAWVRRRFSK